MKKFITAFAAALTISTTAFGVDYTAQCTSVQLGSIDTSKVVALDAESTMAKAPAKAPSAADASGVYYYSYYSGSSSNSGYQEDSWNLIINGTEATIYGIFSDFAVKGTYNPSTGSIVVKPQDLVMNTYYNEMMKLFVLKQYDENLKPLETSVYMDEIEFQYAPDGVKLSNGEIICVGGWLAPDNLTLFVSCDSFKDQDDKGNTLIGGQGFAWHMMNRIQTLEEVYDNSYFKYDASEWKDAGTCKFTDGWFYQRNYTYDVPLKVKSNGSNEFLLVNPYDNAAINSLPADKMGNTASNKAGYIYINAENPDCVLVRPFVTSGWENTESIGNCAINVLNKEGQKVYMEYYESDEVVDELTGIGQKTSSMDENGKITILNAIFALQLDVPNPTAWTYEDGSVVDMTSYVELNLAGVEGIIADAENAPARYFNLQGMEVANPEAGQLVIKKEGSKTTKMIVR